MPDREYRTIDKATWGAGPWMAEPDKKQWTDAETGLSCLIVRGRHGSLCGYVGVDVGHPVHGKHYGEAGEIEVHGGLTYSDGCQHGADESRGICHIPEPGQPDSIWWLGFDCAHSGDFSPGMNARLPPFMRDTLGGPTGWGGFITYRDQAFVEDEVRSLARQLAAMVP